MGSKTQKIILLLLVLLVLLPACDLMQSSWAVKDMKAASYQNGDGSYTDIYQLKICKSVFDGHEADCTWYDVSSDFFISCCIDCRVKWITRLWPTEEVRDGECIR